MSTEALARFVAEGVEGMTSTYFSAFPLIFADHEDVIAEASEFSVLDDFLSDQGMVDFEAEFAERFPTRVAFGLCDVEGLLEYDPDAVVDSYAEFFIAFDSATDEVLVWTGEGGFEPLAESFAAFVASLVAFPVDDEDDPDWAE